MNIVNLFFGFHGRISRTHFWIGVAILIAVEIGLYLVLGIPLDSDVPPDRLVRTIKAVIDLLLLYPTVAVVVKRLHDRNQPTALAWLIVAISLVATVIDFLGWTDDQTNPGIAFWIFAAVTFAIGIAFLIELGFRRGTAGDNRYGPDPLAGQT